jgi:hypothetical protein
MKSIIELAKQAGFTSEDHHAIRAMLERFAHLIRAEVLEECAGVCEQPVDEIQVTDDESDLIYMDGRECAAAIRALKEKT